MNQVTGSLSRLAEGMDTVNTPSRSTALNKRSRGTGGHIRERVRMRRRTALEGVELVRREKIRTVAELYTCME